PDDGDYFVVLHDSRYAGGSPGHYRLKIGSFSFADAIFPLGWRRGSELDVALVGENVSGPKKRHLVLAGPDRLGPLFVAMASEGRQGCLPQRFAIGDAPELLEPDSQSLDDRWFRDAAVMNG